MCGERNPLLGGALPAYETFAFQWRNLSKSRNHPHIGAFILEGLPTALKYHKLMRENKTYLYAMCKFQSISIARAESIPASRGPMHPLLVDTEALGN